MKLIVIIYSFLFARLGSCALYMRCGNFLDPKQSSKAIDINVTDFTNSSNVLEFTNVGRSNFSAFQEIHKNGLELFNVSFVSNNSRSINHVGVISTSGHHGNLSVIVYGNSTENVTKLWLFAGSKPPSHLGIDRAQIRISNRFPYPVNYSELHGDCYKCVPYQLGVLYPGEDHYLKVDTNFEYTLIFVDQMSGQTVCRIAHHYAEHGHYDIQLHDCFLVAVADGDNAFLPILWVSCFLIVMTIVILVPYCLFNHFRLRKWFYVDPTERQIAMDLGNPKSTLERSSDSHAQLLGNKSILVLSESKPLLSTPVGIQPGTTRKKERLRSLDCFRGFSLIIMIFVNYGGGGYWFFDHSRWNGLTVADLVFPWFMWIMGVSMVFSFRGRKDGGILKMLYQIIRRTVILFGLGLFLNNGYDLHHWRIPGVLQRFSLSYFAVATTELFCSIFYRHCSKMPNYRHVMDLLHNWIQLLVATGFIALHLFITFLLPLDDGCPRGYLGPGGIGDHEEHITCTGGAARKIDLYVLGYTHIYQHPTCRELYHTGPYDPEGILGTLNSIALCFLGLQAGKILVHYPSHKWRILRLLIWGIALGLVGATLACFKQNGGWIPINKNLWSLSFILVMGGTAFVLLTLMYVCIDVIKWWNGVPFVYPGMNSIMVYCGSELLQGYFPFSWHHNNETHFSLLASNVVAVGLWILIAYYCYRLKFFVKI